VRAAPARTLAAAGTACLGVVAAAVAYLKVGGLPGMLYASGICLAAFVGAVAIVAGRTEKPVLDLAPSAAPRPTRLRRKSQVIAELEAELAATGTELEEHRRALASLAAQFSRESEEAHRHVQRLEQEIRELETERNGLLELVAEERGRFEQTLDDLGGGIGRHGSELAELERELEALIAR
jgi:DNA repair exonuclease SbcCD ATPase subunit